MTENITNTEKQFANDLMKAHLENTSKFVYFLLSITTVSIGYAISATEKTGFSQWIIVWILSMMAMCYSAHCGMKYLKKANVMLVMIVSAHRENNPKDYEKQYENVTGIEKEAHEFIKKQQIALYVGYFIFFAWHISNMLPK